GFDQRNKHHCYTVWEHCVRAMEAAPAEPLLRFALLLHDLGKPETFHLTNQAFPQKITRLLYAPVGEKT
ncbi:MAG: HD domain-containing protein, partial [Clostridia bacterium]|nr:HD domain-containing protein [Clostridia bacterium]